MFCPGCGCQTSLHDRLIKMGNEVIAHCSGCGPCWKTAKTEFLETVVRHLETKARKGEINLGP